MEETFASRLREAMTAARFTRVKPVRAVEGTFSYNQDVTFSNAELRKAVFEGSDHLCGSADQEELWQSDAQQQSVEVRTQKT